LTDALPSGASSTIADLEVIAIVTPAVNADDCDGAADTVVVRLTDEAGLTGIGEADAPGDLVRAFIERPDLHVWSRNVSELVHPEPEIRDGRMDLPTGPGLGIELDEDAVARYRVDDPRAASA
jgi:L-alanine-DL-glutamate epimerase-like enolase superfamily enzyme